MKKLCLIIALIFLSGCAVTDRMIYGTSIDPFRQKEMPKLPEDATVFITSPLGCMKVTPYKGWKHISCTCALSYAVNLKEKTDEQLFRLFKTAFGKSLKKRHLMSLTCDLANPFIRDKAETYLKSSMGMSWVMPSKYREDYYWKHVGLVNLIKGTHFYKFNKVVKYYTGRFMSMTLPDKSLFSRFLYIIPEHHKAILMIPISASTAKILHPENGIVHHPSMPITYKLDAEIRIIGIDLQFKEKCCPRVREYCMKQVTNLLECVKRLGKERLAKCKYDNLCTKFLKHCNKTKEIFIETLWTYKERERNLKWLNVAGPSW